MIHHPVIVVPKLVILAVIIVVLIILHGSLSPSDYRVAVIVAVVFFLCSVAAIWIIGFKLFSNPKSRISRATILSHEERSEDGFQAFSDESASLVGARGVALTPLRPSGTAFIQGKRISVVSEGAFIPVDSTVEILHTVGARVVVRKVEESTGQQREGQS